MQKPTVPTGAIFSKGSCLFRVWAPTKQQVSLHIINKELNLQLQKEENGYWFTTLDGIEPGDEYLFSLDAQKPVPDVSSYSQPFGVHGNSMVIDTNDFIWDDDDWYGMPLDKMIQYEIHTGTFSSEGNFNGIIKKLDYLKSLGINTIEIMPVAQFPGKKNWGYDGVFPFAVQHSYGGLKELKMLVNEAHKKQIAVILDVVYNHFGPEGNYFEQYAPYFTEKHKTPWGKAINFDGPFCDGVRNYFLYNAWFWMHHCRIDGLRLDAVHAIYDKSALTFIQELNDLKKQIEKETGRKKILIAEFDLNDPKYILKKSKGGYGLDGQWIDEFHHSIHALLTAESMAYYEDFGSIYHIHKAFKYGYVYTGEYSKTRFRHFGVYPKQASPHQFVAFIQNHDHTGNRMLGERLSTLLPPDALKLAAAAYLLSPFVPLIFMGEEYGEKNPFLYFADHSDKNLREIVRKGRKDEFKEFLENGEAPDPFDDETFLRSRLSWNVNDAEQEEILSYYKKIIHLRKTHPAFQNNSKKGIKLYPLTGDKKLIVFKRKNKKNKALVILNFETAPEHFEINFKYELAFYSSREQPFPDGNKIVTPPLSATILNILK